MFEGRRDLLGAFRRGDRGALESVYRAFASEVNALLAHGFAFRSGGTWVRFRGFPPGPEREDALDDVFARAFAAPARTAYDGLRPYGAYLSAIARNVVVDSFRERTRHFEVLAAEPVGEEVASPAEGADEAMLRDEARALAAKFVEALPPRWRRVYDLRFGAGLDREAAARRMGLGEKRLRTVERRIRDSFVRFLSDRGWLSAAERAASAALTAKKETA